LRLFEGFITQIITQNLSRNARKASMSRVIKSKLCPLKTSTDPAPLFTDGDGVVRVGGTRVRLDTVVGAFNEGRSAEEILQQFPSLRLADIYATISYYLQHRSSVDDYLKGRQQEHDRVRQLNESRSDPADLRERLLKRDRLIKAITSDNLHKAVDFGPAAGKEGW
jgi:uncharacterized protein (DUF433 family)